MSEQPRIQGSGAMRRIRVALTWASSVATLAFVVMFATPLVIGGPGAHQGPLLAFLGAPAVFVVTLGLALIWPRLALVTIVASLMFPVWYYVNMPPWDPRISRLVPLSTEERALLQARHFPLRVAVEGGKSYPIYRAELIDDLGKTGLFTSVAASDETDSADLIATVTGSYYGDKTGHSFSLRWPQQPKRRVGIKLWYYASDGPFIYASRHRLLVDRLALEVVRQMDALGPAGQATSPPR
jgi:hypothetical protein